MFLSGEHTSPVGVVYVIFQPADHQVVEGIRRCLGLVAEPVRIEQANQEVELVGLPLVGRTG